MAGHRAQQRLGRLIGAKNARALIDDPQRDGNRAQQRRKRGVGHCGAGTMPLRKRAALR